MREQNYNLIDKPLVESPRCESCGGDTHYPDPLCYRCSEERSSEVYRVERGSRRRTSIQDTEA